jgi:predicted transcriptional regulator
MKALTVRLDDDRYERLRKTAFDERVSINAYVTDAIDNALEPGDPFAAWADERAALTAESFRKGYNAARTEANR